MLTQLINDFILSCRARRLSPRTIEWYEWLLSEYRAFTEKRGLDWTQPATLDAHLAEVAGHSSAHTLHAHYRALRRFFRWLEKRRLIAENPMRMIEPPRLPARQPRHILPDDVIRLLATTASGGWLDLRDRAVILMLWDSGLRAGELCGLPLSSLDLEKGLVLIRSGKGDKDRWIALGNAARDALRDWLAVRDERAACDRLFVGWHGGPLTRYGLSLMLRRRAKAAGINRPVGPHTFRHGFAVAYLNNGGKIHNLRRLLGHTTLRSTEVYLSVADREAVADHAQASPGDHLVK
jgi:site-specific recombinase XerD